MSASIEHDVLYGADQAVATLVKELVGLKGHWEKYVALGVVKHGAIVGGVVFHGHRPEAYDIEITAGFTTPRWCSPATFSQIMRYPLHQLGCRRCTAKVAASNAHARRFLARLGFVEEGRQRRGYDGAEDLVLYGVLRPEGRWREC